MGACTMKCNNANHVASKPGEIGLHNSYIHVNHYFLASGKSLLASHLISLY